MSTAVSTPAPFEDDDQDGRGGAADETPDAEAAEAFLESLPSHLRSVRARGPLTREDLPRRGGSLEDPQLSEATQRVWDAQKHEARALAEKYRSLAGLYEHDGDYEETTELDSVNTTRAALALRVTGSAAGWWLRDAYQAVHLFPQCLAALESGRMASAWFQKMLKSSRSLSDASRRNLDIAVVSWSFDIGPERFFTLLKKLIDLLERREERPDPLSSLTRSVELLPCAEAGMGIIQISGPIPEILAQWKQLDESARAVQTAQRTALREGTTIPHDPEGRVLETGRALPLSQLRFALLGSAGLDLDGVTVPTGRFRLNVTVPMMTMLGASDEPGLLEGTIPLPPSMARSLAAGEEAWYRVLTDGATGAFLPLPAEKYVPTAAMLEYLRLRNSTCAVPGCARPISWASECDHIEECLRGNPDAGGLTEVENLHLLCWQHHLDKTNGLLDPTRLPTTQTQPGRTRWSIGPTTGNDAAGVDVVTVIDDLDTASIQTAEDLTRAWSHYLRGHHAADPATTEPTSTDSTDTDATGADATRGDSTGADSTGPEPPRPRGTGRVIPLPRPTGHSEGPPTTPDTDTTAETPPTPTGDEPPPPSEPHPSRNRTDTPPDQTGTPPNRTETPPGPWGEYGPPPF